MEHGTKLYYKSFPQNLDFLILQTTTEVDSRLHGFTVAARFYANELKEIVFPVKVGLDKNPTIKELCDSGFDVDAVHLEKEEGFIAEMRSRLSMCLSQINLKYLASAFNDVCLGQSQEFIERARNDFSIDLITFEKPVFDLSTYARFKEFFDVIFKQCNGYPELQSAISGFQKRV